ncbi:MAG: DUF3787 domain-containing protein [Clostridia bacterium]
MAENIKKEHFMQKPIERHDTAAWANIYKMKPVSQATVPSELEVRNAKEHADTNQK